MQNYKQIQNQIVEKNIISKMNDTTDFNKEQSNR